jgi:hypothetical protein
MSEKKAPNYTEAQAEELKKAYVAISEKSYEIRDKVVAEFAEKFGKNKASIIAKLNSLGVYKKKEYTKKTGSKPETKAAIVTVIASALGCTEEQLQGFERASKPALEFLRGWVQSASNTISNLSQE